MSKKKKKKIDLHNLTPEEELKYEIAEELGLRDRVMKDGWKSLSAKETGRVGGLMTRRKKGKFPVSRKKRMRYNKGSNFTGQQEET